MAQFTDEDKKEISQNYFGEGVFKVKISGVHGGITESDKEYLEFSIIEDDGEREAEARLWFSEKAKRYSFNTIRTIFVHNTKEENKDKIREKVNEINDTKEMEKLCQNLIGKECWYMVQKSDTTYTDKFGNERPNYNKNLYGYEPKLKEVSKEASIANTVSGEIIESTKDEPFPDF